MAKTKLCYTCKELKTFDCFSKHRDGKYGLQGRCKKCCSKNIKAIRYKKAVKQPILLSWQPKPGEKFDAYLGRNWCELNPFVCVRNGTTVVICTTPEGRHLWQLDKSAYIFGRTN